MKAFAVNTAREQFGAALGRAGRGWRAELDARLVPFGLTQARWLTLYHLARGGGNGLPQTALAEGVGVQGPTLVRTLDRLESDGLVERRDSLDDRRAKSIHVTAAAAPVLKRIQSVADQVRTDLLAGVSNAEIAVCLRVFERIGANIQADRKVADQRAEIPRTKT
ncbi:transcriptional regulator SlyA [Piscinibacter sakaiensis]|uniref:transcriptional regulator SlyA n=1 Tax=Piscinibacter sakaiensis TaxID=1547922 RepID=UPI003AB0DE31